MKRIAIIFAGALLAVVLLGACGRGRGESTRDGDVSGYDPIIITGPVIPGDGPIIPGVGTVAPDGTRLIPAVRALDAPSEIRWGFNPALYGPDVFEVRYGMITNIPVGGIVWHLEQESISPRCRNAAFGSEVDSFLSRHFNVELVGVHTPNVSEAIRQEAHIFPAGVYATDVVMRHGEAEMGVDTVEAAEYRTVSEEMIRRYAPNYAALLDKHDGWEVSRAPNGEQRALNMFRYNAADLSVFSLYRLDVLEGYGIAPPGPLIQIAEGVYFSERSFTRYEFSRIMARLAFCETNTSPYVFGYPDLTHLWAYRISPMFSQTDYHAYHCFWESFAPILGMFGVNLSIMEQGGYALPFFATDAFRDAAFFISDMARQGLIKHRRWGHEDRHRLFMDRNHRIGWTSVHINDLHRVITTSQQNDPTRRFLITPPENGDHNNRGIGLLQTDPWNPDDKLWHIGLQVTDDELSRILNMFDGMSFDPQVHAIVRFGVYAESPFYEMFDSGVAYRPTARFAWSGEPHASAIIDWRPQQFAMREGVFFTGIVDGETWPRHFVGGYGAIDDFARSAEGRAMNLLPTRTSGEHASARAELEARHWDTLMHLARFFLVNAMEIHHINEWGRVILSTGHPRPGSVLGIISVLPINITELWQTYLDNLNEHGLQELIGLYSLMPTR